MIRTVLNETAALHGLIRFENGTDSNAYYVEVRKESKPIILFHGTLILDNGTIRKTESPFASCIMTGYIPGERITERNDVI